jgi:hypothetical protein
MKCSDWHIRMTVESTGWMLPVSLIGSSKFSWSSLFHSSITVWKKSSSTVYKVKLRAVLHGSLTGLKKIFTIFKNLNNRRWSCMVTDEEGHAKQNEKGKTEGRAGRRNGRRIGIVGKRMGWAPQQRRKDWHPGMRLIKLVKYYAMKSHLRVRQMELAFEPIRLMHRIWFGFGWDGIVCLCRAEGLAPAHTDAGSNVLHIVHRLGESFARSWRSVGYFNRSFSVSSWRFRSSWCNKQIKQVINCWYKMHIKKVCHVEHKNTEIYRTIFQLYSLMLEFRLAVFQIYCSDIGSPWFHQIRRFVP